MKNKIQTITKRENKKESLIKFEKLADKLANHFKIKLKSLLAEKNYKHSQLMLDIKSFFRHIEDYSLETDQIVPKMENYLIEILSRQASNNYNETYETCNTNDTNKTDEPISSGINKIKINQDINGKFFKLY